ncbi:MAG: hypothetical protein LQ352_006067 [Teloschistes flavicans]|nr:MAG: hypothetical protein LQ352_006067 [Teloschistes flavicans]
MPEQPDFSKFISVPQLTTIIICRKYWDYDPTEHDHTDYEAKDTLNFVMVSKFMNHLYDGMKTTPVDVADAWNRINMDYYIRNKDPGMYLVPIQPLMEYWSLLKIWDEDFKSSVGQYASYHIPEIMRTKSKYREWRDNNKRRGIEVYTKAEQEMNQDLEDDVEHRIKRLQELRPIGSE